MSVWSVLTGQRSDKTLSSPGLKDEHQPAAISSASSALAPQTDLPSDSISTTDASSSPYYVPFPVAVDPLKLHPLANIAPDTLEYLRLDDSALTDLPGARSALPSRGWTDDLCYGTGITYLTGLGVGGLWGLIEGVNRAPSTASPRLKLNYILNAVTRRGPFLGNSAGVVAVTYNSTNSLLGYSRGKHDALNSIAAGAISGVIFKSTRGLKQMMISGALVAGAAGVWTVPFVNGLPWVACLIVGCSTGIWHTLSTLF